MKTVAARSFLVSLTLGLCIGAWGCKGKTTAPAPPPTLTNDLMITTGSPTLGSLTAISGQTMDLASSWTVKNQGTGTSAAFM